MSTHPLTGLQVAVREARNLPCQAEPPAWRIVRDLVKLVWRVEIQRRYTGCSEVLKFVGFNSDSGDPVHS